MESSLDTRKGGGQLLSDSVRASVEPRLAIDFSGVEVHTDKEAETLTRALHSCAFTTGQDIFLQQRKYHPSSRAVQVLLAHELRHVV
jgi:hypothetical protein